MHLTKTADDQCSTIMSLIENNAASVPDAPAIAAPGRKPLTYAGLRDQVYEVASRLEAIGIERHDKIAIVQPNGPEMAVSFLAISAAVASAPLNPGYSRAEFEFYISDLKPRAILLQQGIDSPAIAVAQSLGVPILEVAPQLESEAGLFTLGGDSRLSAFRYAIKDHRYANRDSNELALVLHTSGTTSRPKKVGLTLSNILISAGNISSSLSLSASDRCLNIMPLFHVHGLIGALLSSLMAKASVFCTPGFYAPLFFEWVKEYRPTWYTAVPTMHQSILARVYANTEIIDRHQLRFIRSASSPLPEQVMGALEQVFRAPVIEAYGMTEAAHQIASNPLPPGERKPGTVGLAQGVRVAIMGPDRHLLGPGEIGEVVLQGPCVMAAYLDNAEATETAFVDGWFKTGDLGDVDPNGYVSLRGRIKEVINRGGEKVSPVEIDEVLMRHPAIEQAICFSIPDSMLGEDIGAAVVLRDDVAVTDAEIRRFVAERLATFKVPGQIVFVKEIPKGATGKLQRIGLAAKLGLISPRDFANQAKPDHVAARTPVEKALVAIWEEVLGIDRIGILDTFLSLGGDSVLAVRIVSLVRDEMNIDIPVISLFEAPTVESMALLVLGHMGDIIGFGEMESVLSELEGMPDEEVGKLTT